MNVKRTCLFLIFCFFSAGIVCFLAGCSETDSGDYKPFRSVQSDNVGILSDRKDPDSQTGMPADGTTTRTVADDSSASNQRTGSGSVETESANLDTVSTKDETPELDPTGNAKPAESQSADLEPVLAEKPTRSEHREIKILVPEKKFRVVGPEKAIRVSYDDINLLKVINMEPVTLDAPEHMPDWLKGLNGKRIRIRGFMSPTFEQTGLKVFLMGRDNQACCFPGRAKIYDLFPVRLRQGKTTDFIDNRPFDIVGIFSIKPWVEDDTLYQLYQLDDAVVIEK
ncbi:MAG: hypothetical protein IH899_02690 [Planctomycetes bacterium]|nr:hypothetical protein [Planctomycetota bacterium]